MRHPGLLAIGAAALLGAAFTAPVSGLNVRTAAAQDRVPQILANQQFRVDFTASPGVDSARITGYVYNADGKAVDDVLLRIIELDSSGYAMASYVEPLREMVPALGSTPFDVRVPGDAASYRVIVDSWTTVEAPAR
jgi:hypothetical protein